MSVKEKFLDYVSYDTQSDSSSTTMPSTMKQKLLAQHLADEMVAMGIEDAHMDEWGYVYGTIPANCEKKNVGCCASTSWQMLRCSGIAPIQAFYSIA